jgi:hypothetical protein
MPPHRRFRARGPLSACSGRKHGGFYVLVGDGVRLELPALGVQEDEGDGIKRSRLVAVVREDERLPDQPRIDLLLRKFSFLETIPSHRGDQVGVEVPDFLVGSHPVGVHQLVVVVFRQALIGSRRT